MLKLNRDKNKYNKANKFSKKKQQTNKTILNKSIQMKNNGKAGSNK